MAPIYDGSLPIPTVYLDDTFHEKRHQTHHLSLPYLRHTVGRMVHNPDLDAHSPATDVRESQSHYFFDVELPGLSDKSKLKLRWTSTRTLLIEARIERPHLPDCPAATKGSAQNTTTENSCTCFPSAKTDAWTFGHPDSSAQPATTTTPTPTTTTVTTTEKSEKTEKKQDKPSTHLTVSERRIGYFSRSFHFPVDVEYEGLKASLDHGLLSIRIAKHVGKRVPEDKATVEVE